MARKWGASHMAWVRSHKKKGRRNPSVRGISRRTSRRYMRRSMRNPYPIAGLAINPRRRRRNSYQRNPRILGFELPNLMSAVYGGVGFIGVPLIEGVFNGFLPVSLTANTIGKYVVRIGAVVAETMLAKMVLGRKAAVAVAVGGGSFVVVSAVKDFAPGLIPGLSAYTAGSNRVMPTQMAAYMKGGRQQVTLGAPPFGARNTAAFAGRGGANVVAARFRRFQ